MALLDWVVMLGTILLIVIYGMWKSRKRKNMESYLLDRQEKWWTIGLSVMATQASAITFLATPGVAFAKDMGFVQFYFGLPIAMIIIAVFFIPLYYRLKVYTAYEFLESRFDNKTRLLTAFLFLIQRGLAAGITIFAPSIVLSQIMGWNLVATNVFIGGLVILYTVSGGTRAVSQTHKQQMAVIFVGLFVAFALLMSYIPLDFMTSLKVAGEMGKMEIINLDFNPEDRYNIWSGILGGLFLQLSYFGTDQSQVQRYLSGRSMRDSRLGLMFNGLVKIPMQFFILLIGVMVFVFYLFVMPPVHFNTAAVDKVKNSTEHQERYQQVEAMHKVFFNEKKKNVEAMAAAIEAGDATQVAHYRSEIQSIQDREAELKTEAKALLSEVDPKAEDVTESNFVFLDFIINYMPVGVIGLLLAMIFSGAMSSTSAELNALASTTTVDMYKRNIQQRGTEKHYLFASKGFTFLWGIFALGFALLAAELENLVEAVNVLGSIFYPVILGIFLVAFFIKFVKANAVFVAALITQGTVIWMYFYTDIGFLWYNVIGVGLVIVLAMIMQGIIPTREVRS